MIRRPPISTLFPTRRSSDLPGAVRAVLGDGRRHRRGDHDGEQRPDRPALRQGPGDGHAPGVRGPRRLGDRKSTRLNSSHVRISYAVFCLKKKKQIIICKYQHTFVVTLTIYYLFNDTATTDIYTLSYTTLFRSARGCSCRSR